jgi:hypothetical protein
MAINVIRWSVKPKIPGAWHDTVDYGSFKVELAEDWIEVRKEDDDQEEYPQAAGDKIIRNILLGIALEERTSFTPTLRSSSRITNQGERVDAMVFISGASMTLSAGDVIVTTADGAVIGNPRKKRLEDLRRFAEDAAANPPLQRMADFLTEYYADPNKKLATLYDLIEYAMKIFNSDKKGMVTALGISGTSLKDTKKLMHTNQLRTSRHRGRELGPYRNPTAEETAVCEGLAERIVRGYSEFIRQQSEEGN